MLAEHDPPHTGVLRELVALEGRDEPLTPGAVFPTPPRPVRDGLPLWHVQVKVRSDDERAFDRWYQIPERLSHPRLDDYGGYGADEGPDGVTILETSLRIWAANDGEAASVAHELLDRLLDDTEPQRRLVVTRAHAPDAFDLPRSPKDYEPRLVRRRWHRFEPAPTGVKIVWCTGGCPLARVDVDESPEQITITLWEEFPPRFAEGGTRIGLRAISKTRCVEIPLAAGVEQRLVVDGSTGAPPDQIDLFDSHTPLDRQRALETDLETLTCVAPPTTPCAPA